MTEATLIGDVPWASGYFFPGVGDAVGYCVRLEGGRWVDVGGETSRGIVLESLVEWRGRVVGCGSHAYGGAYLGVVVELENDGWVALADTLSGEGLVATVYGGDLIVGGRFDPETFRNVWRWDGATWRSMGHLAGTVYAMREVGGDLIAGGVFTVFGVEEAIARWNGTEWEGLGGGLVGPGYSGVYSLAEHHGRLFAGGSFRSGSDTQLHNIAFWDGARWNDVGGGADGDVLDLDVWNDRLVAGGGFWRVGGVDTKGIAVWDGSSWSDVGSGANGLVTSLAVQDQCCIAAGRFTEIDGNQADRVAIGCEPIAEPTR